MNMLYLGLMLGWLYLVNLAAGVLLGHVPGRDGRQGPSPGGRLGPAAWP